MYRFMDRMDGMMDEFGRLDVLMDSEGWMDSEGLMKR